MFISGKIFVYCAILLSLSPILVTTVQAESANDMRSIVTRYKNIGHVDEVTKFNRTIKVSGKVFNLAAGITILQGYDKRSTYKIDVLSAGMQIGYKLEHDHPNTITELWIMPE